EITTPVRSQSAWRMVTGTFRTVTWAPGCPQAALNSGRTADRVPGGKPPHPAMGTAMIARTTIPAQTRHTIQGARLTVVGRGGSPFGSPAAPHARRPAEHLPT